MAKEAIATYRRRTGIASDSPASHERTFRGNTISLDRPRPPGRSTKSTV